MQAVLCEVFVNQYIIGILLFVQIFIWKKRYRILHKKEVEYMEIGKKIRKKQSFPKRIPLWLMAAVL